MHTEREMKKENKHRKNEKKEKSMQTKCVIIQEMAEANQNTSES